jgi:hypothetical protein
MTTRPSVYVAGPGGFDAAGSAAEIGYVSTDDT